MNQSLYVWAKTMLPNYILSNLGDRMEMAHSVEGRLPFLDHHVVEAGGDGCRSSMKINGMTEKYVLREAARPVLTDAVYKRQKHPFMSPPATIQTERPAVHVAAGHAAQRRARRSRDLRSREGRTAARRDPDDGRRRPRPRRRAC